MRNRKISDEQRTLLTYAQQVGSRGFTAVEILDRCLPGDADAVTRGKSKATLYRSLNRLVRRYAIVRVKRGRHYHFFDASILTSNFRPDPVEGIRHTTLEENLEQLSASIAASAKKAAAEFSVK
jgi:hypothetical protein